MKDWLRGYFRAVIASAPPNLKIGNEMKFGIRYRLADGSWTDIKVIATVTKDEL